MALVSIVTTGLASLTVFGQALIAIGLLSLLRLRWRRFTFERLSRYGILLALIVAVVATAGSLFYSEIAGYEPCTLCWYQRIAMYPQVLILGLALAGAETCAGPSCLMLSLIGAAIAGYHYLLQIGVAVPTSCSAVGYAVDCSERFFMTFGYITIPMMALTAFLLIAGAAALSMAKVARGTNI